MKKLHFGPYVLLVWIAALSLTACGGSGNGSTSSSTISASDASLSSSTTSLSPPTSSAVSESSISSLMSSTASSETVSSSSSNTPALIGKPYKGAEIFSYESARYGKYVMRMRVAKGSGVLSTFFLYKAGSQNAGTFWEEIDIEIFGQNNAIYWESNIIYGNPKQETYLRHTASQSLADAYHTYTLEWTPDYVAWFVDGIQIRRINGGPSVTSLTSEQTMRFNLWSAHAESWVGPFDPAILPVYQFINYVEYHSYDTEAETFSFEWRDDFDSLDNNRWGAAEWTFDDNRVDFVPENAVVQNGVLVLALTTANATGFHGTVPEDIPPAPPVEILIQAEDYDFMGTSVTIVDGVVTEIDSGDWIKYANVDIPQTGLYRVEYRLSAATDGGAITLDQDGAGLAYIAVPATGGFDTFTTIAHEVNLTVGQQNLAIYAGTGGFNVDWLKLTLLSN